MRTAPRFDIQVLRGVAVVLVLAYHASIGARRGFIGVDVFFVISGFLMGRIILTDLESGCFSLRAFFLRRVRRLAPAMLTTLLAVTFLGVFLLTSEQWREYQYQLVGAVTMTANMFLWHQGGYFDSHVETRPLLHFWSLAVEEQFYILFPLALLLLPRRARVPAIFLAAFLSSGLFGWAIVSGRFNGLAYYALPTRLWQLLAGAICAWAMMRHPKLCIHRLIKLGALAGLLAVALGHGDNRIPSIFAVGATAVMLLGRDGWLAPSPATRILKAAGDMSYSLYLVHWPLLAFAANLYAGSPPRPVVFGLLALSILLGWAQYRFIEVRFRARSAAPRGLTRLAAMTGGPIVLLLAVPVIAAHARPAPPRPEPVLGLDRGCVADWRSQDRPACRTSDRPRVALWGDSFAMHLIPGLLARPSIAAGFVQYTLPSCSPIVGIARPETGAIGYGASCLRFNAAVQQEMLGSSGIEAVVLSATWDMIGTGRPRLLLTQQGTRDVSHEAAVEALVATVRALEASGKAVFIVGPTPAADERRFDPALCNIRKLERRAVLGGQGCTISRRRFHERLPALKAALRDVAARSNARLYLLEDALCVKDRCATRAGRILLYRDNNHLSQDGSKLVVDRLGINQAIDAVLSGR